jgi:hypothetical protein
VISRLASHHPQRQQLSSIFPFHQLLKGRTGILFDIVGEAADI